MPACLTCGHSSGQRPWLDLGYCLQCGTSWCGWCHDVDANCPGCDSASVTQFTLAEDAFL